MFDPVALARKTARMVTQDNSRKYYRFRPARFYGGIATADCLGCCLRCVFCWAYEGLTQIHRRGRFYTPAEVAHRLVQIAQKKRFSQVRLSGHEPTLAMPHLLAVLTHLPLDLSFILETNGIVLGAEPRWAAALATFPQVFVRVSLKGTDEAEFSQLTGARPEGFALQLAALEHLLAAGVECHPAVMVSFSPEDRIEALRLRLAQITPAFADFEVEELILYPAVAKRLAERGLSYRSAYLPDDLPQGQI